MLGAVTVYLQVNDQQQLLDAARCHPDANGMATEDFYDDAGEINLSACLRMLIDPGSLPGCEVLECTAELTEV